MNKEDLITIFKILDEFGFVDHYKQVLIDYIKSKFEDSKLAEITPNFLYSALMFELGRNNAKSIAEYFEDYKKTGVYKTKVQRFLDNSPWTK
jgi:hypothetical protein